ncbi:hypothetical protein G5V57_28735 [Nordella sp. HKS 07]|uniref:hypothetical protein n=1 Tax=Nordella sp. HKS 07 TaxID=2712222 RepID=UPI0013E1E139|nr:hypothetical protein [Nordella sp. HKS 07]QIG51350.1 hypothetical protein G5V57_28735 [Nordella sp. HKS 07]
MDSEKVTPAELYDVVVIGSSPLSLLEAVIGAESGLRVCVVERAERLGGAWMTEDCLGLTGIETSPHVFMPHRAAYDLADAKLAGNFRTVPIQPVLHVRRNGALFRDSTIPITKQMRYELAMATVYHWDAGTGLWQAARYLLSRLAQMSGNRNPGEAKYPGGGLTRWFDRIQIILRRIGVEARLGTSVDVIQITGERVVVTTADGGEIRCRQVVLNNHISLRAMNVDQTPVQLKLKQSISDHYTYVVRGTAPRGFVQFAGEVPLVLANDVSDYIPDLDQVYPGARVITARAKNGVPRSEAIATAFFDALRSVDYVSKNAEIVAAHHRELATSKMSRGTIRKITKAAGRRVKILTADELGITYSMARR